MGITASPALCPRSVTMTSDPRGGRHGTETRQARIHLRSSSCCGGIRNDQHVGRRETRGRLEGALGNRDDLQV